MQVILLERVPKLGQMGQVVTVKGGYARNFLIPGGKALRATKPALEDFEKRRLQLEAVNIEQRQEAEKLAKQVEGRSVVILRQASESNQLYGSVSARDVAAAFTESGLTLDRLQIRLDQPLKTLGIHKVPVALHPEVEVTVSVNVARSSEEADIQSGVAPAIAEEQAPEEEEEEEELRMEDLIPTH